jgi:hypothetical protein
LTLISEHQRGDNVTPKGATHLHCVAARHPPARLLADLHTAESAPEWSIGSNQSGEPHSQQDGLDQTPGL